VALPADAMGKALGGDGSGEQRLVDRVDLDRCLTRLEKASPQAGRVVSLRILGGASMEDIAEVMGVTRQTVHKHWKVGGGLARRMLEARWTKELNTTASC